MLKDVTVSRLEEHEVIQSIVQRLQTLQGDPDMPPRERTHRLSILRGFLDKLADAGDREQLRGGWADGRVHE